MCRKPTHSSEGTCTVREDVVYIHTGYSHITVLYIIMFIYALCTRKALYTYRLFRVSYKIFQGFKQDFSGFLTRFFAGGGGRERTLLTH